ncbi:MAG TPA: hypothetical protein VMI13_04650 [Solirubrobacteraceae bacterium]|nr:hypothetical protein [Solirubrobacteraceae bacterium]
MAAASPQLRALARLAPVVITIAATCAAAAGALADPTSETGPTARALLRSRELWATIDVCNTSKQPNTIGLRGSMPGDGKSEDKLYMSFSLEYLNATNQWAPLTSSSSGWVLVGPGANARQGGWSFTLKPSHSRPKLVLRGVVGFRWMRSNHPFAHTTRATTPGRHVLVGAEPAGYSAARCTL